ncbi:MAG: DNA mismatch repair endonuclease MutL [Bacteroidales bacterium]|jgi:DNA mismatch repair protein MutL
MLNIIKLLPDSVANQIAAGEVIQRPASAVKELLENAIDAGGTMINLIIKEAGKILIQVTDNGSGLSMVDARMSFERHATSKITKADDLFSIKTMGFRGEALASVAAIAQVEMKTKPHDDEVGTCLRIEGSKVIEQNPCQCQSGTSISVKNLFFNVPARRNFLKSVNVENRHILEEFIRVAVIQHEIGFSYFNNDKLVYKLTPGSFKSRIVGLFGQPYNERLLHVDQKTELVTISGFIGKPEFAKKTRGEQYFFVNHRYIKHPYLHHAVANAFTELIPSDAHPTYFINLEIDPAEIDINIHPTKTEINFKDARLVYAMLHAAIRQSIGKHAHTPTIDFNVDPSIEAAFSQRPAFDLKQPEVRVNPDYNPFKSSNEISRGFKSNDRPSNMEWESLFETVKNKEEAHTEAIETTNINELVPESDASFLQVKQTYLMCNVRNGLMLIHQQRAHERILYEYFMHQLKNHKHLSQQQLFPEHLHFSPEDANILKQLNEDLKTLGFMLEPLGTNTFVVNGTPPDAGDTLSLLEQIIENHKKEANSLNYDQNAMLAKSMAMSMSIKAGFKLSVKEMSELFNNLFTCQVPSVSPSGKKVLAIINTGELENYLK